MEHVAPVLLATTEDRRLSILKHKAADIACTELEYTAKRTKKWETLHLAAA